MVRKQEEIPFIGVLVTPVWNDVQRFAEYGPQLAAALTASKLQLKWVVADDGSEKGQLADLQVLVDDLKKVYPQVCLFSDGIHRGKGGTIRRVWNEEDGAKWLGFVDADGSLRAEDAVRFFQAAIDSGQSRLGVRKDTEETRVVESFHRALAHHLFIFAVRLLLGLRVEDPQCGAKVLRADAYRRVSSLLVEEGLAFDSEMLSVMAQHGAKFTQEAVTWCEKPGGTVHPWRDGWGMLAALWRIRRRFARGLYQLDD